MNFKTHITIIFILIGSSTVFCQTESIEKDNLSTRYKNGELTIEKYRQYANDWQRMIKDIGGYPNFPYDSASTSIRYVTIQETGLSKKINFNRIMEWSAINFGSLNNVLRYENYEDGKIILKGNFNVTHKKEYRNFWGSSKEGITVSICNQTYIFTIKDNKIKTEILDITFLFVVGAYYSSSSYIPERKIQVSIHNLYPITNFENSKWQEKLDMLKQANVRIYYLVRNLNNYVKNYYSDIDF